MIMTIPEEGKTKMVAAFMFGLPNKDFNKSLNKSHILTSFTLDEISFTGHAITKSKINDLEEYDTQDNHCFL